MNRSVARVLAAASVVAFLVVGFQRLRFDTDVLALLPKDLPTVQALVLHQRHFASSTELYITLHGEDADVVEDSARALAHHLRGIEGLARWVVWSSPWDERPDLAAELMAAGWLNAPPAAVQDLADRLRPDRLGEHLRAVRDQLATSLSPAELAQAGYDPLGLLQVPGFPSLESSSTQSPRWSSADGRFRVLMATPPPDMEGYRDSNAWLDRVRDATDEWKSDEPARANLRIRFTGGPAFAAEISRGMEHDMRASVLGTAAVIILVFFSAHRNLRPLLVLLSLLAFTVLATLATGGMVFARLNAVSLGFAAILLGLTVDYGLVLYQEAAAHPELAARDIRRRVGPGVGWAALTTSAAFAALAFGGLPGLTQLGLLVACGTLIGAGLMLAFFLSPRLMGRVRQSPSASLWLPDRVTLVISLALLAVATVLLLRRGWPGVDPSAAPLRLQHSEADGTLRELRRLLEDNRPDPTWIIAHGVHEAAVVEQLQAAESLLASTGLDTSEAPITSSYLLPTALWPNPARHVANRPILAALAAQQPQLQAAFLSAGFTEDAFRLASRFLETWRRAGDTEGTFWPTNELSAWTLDQMTARVSASDANHRFLALGFAQPASPAAAPVLHRHLREAGLLVGSWDSLGTELLAKVESRLLWVGSSVLGLWLAALGLTFRSFREMALEAAAVAFGLFLLLATMAALGWKWNLMNLMALPLLLGAGTDYAIHLQLALRRHRGELEPVHRGTGRAVLLCAVTTIAGFTSLALSSNAGLASLGAVCAVGLTCIYFVSAHLLPAWWRFVHRRTLPGHPVSPSPTTSTSPALHQPSSLYAAAAWRIATAATRLVPLPVLSWLTARAAVLYALLVPSRRRVVAQNLLPLVQNEPRAARRAAWRNFAAFGSKLADLWTYEIGRPIEPLFMGSTGLDYIDAERAAGRGMLLVTPHLGNWELGARLLAARGIQVLVVTLAEPGDGLTELRQAARSRWGIETLVIRQDPFAFVTLIQRLQDGATVALLLDRPPPPSAVTVTLFDRPFPASIAAAELARASGCTLLPTVIVRSHDSHRYTAHVLPPVPYDRRQLGRREARIALTQDILRAFEPWLRQYPEQWFHFVPVWTASEDGRIARP